MAVRSLKLDGMLNPNALIKRTVWSSPQGIKACRTCVYWAANKCGNLTIMAAYGKVPSMDATYYCNFHVSKEKDDG